MAQLAGRVENEIIWDPFCGSGLELIECALLGGVKTIHGTDLSEQALSITRNNFTAAQINSVKTNFIQADFRDHARQLLGERDARVGSLLRMYRLLHRDLCQGAVESTSRKKRKKKRSKHGVLDYSAP